MTVKNTFTLPETLDRLVSLSCPAFLVGMERFGIDSSHAYGIRIPALRNLAREIGRDHPLSLALWKSEIHEAQILATLVADPNLLTYETAEAWCKTLNSWDTCDQLANNLLWKAPYANSLALAFTERKEEFVKRMGFALCAVLAVHLRGIPNSFFNPYLERICAEAWDDRNFVRKAVNWALRNIGKRNEVLRQRALETGHILLTQNTPSATWIARNALQELENPKTYIRGY